MDLNSIKTEQRNSRTAQIDTMSTLSMVKLINEEDKKVAEAVGAEAEHIAQAVDVIAAQLKQGGRLVYSGCGTSGRLGILDAVECPPTYSTDPGEIIGLIAGGNEAIFRAKEGAEDDEAMGADDLKKINFGSKDVLVGIAASGRTPYVLGAMNYAKAQGAHVIGISCNPGSQVEKTAEIAITPAPGPEEVLLQKERLETLSRLLSAMSAGDRALFYRKYYYLQSTEQMAAELGTTARAVEGRLYRIRKKLQKQMGGELA